MLLTMERGLFLKAEGRSHGLMNSRWFFLTTNGAVRWRKGSQERRQMSPAGLLPKRTLIIDKDFAADCGLTTTHAGNPHVR